MTKSVSMIVHPHCLIDRDGSIPILHGSMTAGAFRGNVSFVHLPVMEQRDEVKVTRLAGKRELSMSMVRRLRERFQISADLLISPMRPRGLAA